MNFEIPKTHWLKLPECTPEKQNMPRLYYYRKTFVLDHKPSILRLRVSADSRYKLYVNGQLKEIGPAKGDDQVWYADTADIAELVREGENVIAVQVLVYPVNGPGNQSIYRTSSPGLYAEDLDGYGLSADSSWKCMEEEDFRIIPENPFFAPLHILENRKGDPKTENWKQSGYDDSAWMNAVPYNILEISPSSVPGDLTERTIPSLFLRKRRFLSTKKIRSGKTDFEQWNALIRSDIPLAVPSNSISIVEFDAGEELTGFLSLRMKNGRGAKIKLLTAECYVKNDENAHADLIFSFPHKGDRTDAENGVLYGYTDTYTVGGYKDEEVYEPFWFRTFRYVGLEIETGDEPLIINGFDYQQTGYPLETVSCAETSDPDMKAIWDISLRSLQNCMHETYEDCPFYEQLQYAMDSRSQILYTYAVSGDDRLARKCMEDFRRSQRADGIINSSYPTTRSNVVPGFGIYYILMLEDHMMYFGDADFLRIHLGAVDGVLDYFERHRDNRGIVGITGGLNMQSRYWSFIDWTDQWRPTTGVPDAILQGPITMESLLYILGLQSAARINRYIGRISTAEEYEKRADSVKEAVRKYCRSENGMILDGPGVDKISQHGQVFAILTDTVSAEEGREYLKETLEHKEKYAQCSVAMAFYLFRALEQTGLYEKTDSCWDLWRDMLKKNLTTCVEDNVNQRSDCHAWGAAILYELPSAVLGVRPAAPGYEKISVCPSAGTLNWAKGQVITKHGIVHIQWKKKDDGSLDLQYTAPEGVEVCLDHHPERK